jgi:predicted membrane metal-binding protein
MANRAFKSWQSSLLATSGLAAALFAASQLWQQGLAEWGFLLGFAAVWALVALSWSSAAFTERSGILLARIMDRNFEQMHERVVVLEQEVQTLREQLSGPYRKAS